MNTLSSNPHRKNMNSLILGDVYSPYQINKHMTQIPVMNLNVQGMFSDSEKTELQDKIEDMYLENLDRDDADQLLKYRITRLESDVRRLDADLTAQISNRDHFRQLVGEQDAFIREAKRQIEDYKFKQDAELKTKTSEAEHLAKQAIRLNEENSKLLKEHVEIMFRHNQLTDQMPILIEEKRKLQEQVNQYECYGCRSGHTGEYCGGCLGCMMRQAEHSMSETNKELRFEKSIASYKDSIISTLNAALLDLKSMTCISWRKQAKIYRNCVDTATTFQRIIDKLLEQQKKG